MPDTTANPTRLVISDLPQSKPTRFRIEPDAETLAGLRDSLELQDLRKVRFVGEVAARGKRDWMLRAELGATVIQPCVATLAPVTTRIDAHIERIYIAGMTLNEDDEAEMPEDDRLEPLPSVIDLIEVLSEGLSLHIPDYPRADDANPIELSVTEPGKVPMTDDDAKPFAGLGALRDQLAKGDKEG